MLVTSSGDTLAIDRIEKEPREATVYNFEVADFESYFVSNLGIWVHNCTVKKHNSRNIKDTEAWGDIEKFLGKGKQTDINPFTGKKDADRIFVVQKDGSVRAVRIGDHEVRKSNALTKEGYIEFAY